jgi:hypothetical protein
MSEADVVGSNGLSLKANLSDVDYGNGVVLQVEVKPAEIPFTDVPGAVSPVLSSGATAMIKLLGPTGVAVHWQARTVDHAGAASEWVRYSGATASEEAPPSYGGGGGGGCGGTVAVRPPVWILPLALVAALALVPWRRLRCQES